MKLYETKTGKTYKLTMRVWDGSQYGPDMSDAILSGSEDYDSDRKAYIIDDVEHLFDWLEEWTAGEDESTRDELYDLISVYGEPDGDDDYIEDPEHGFFGRHPVAALREDISGRLYSLDEIPSEPKFYFFDDGVDLDEFFGSKNPCCISEAVVRRLSRKYDVNLFAMMHEASDAELEKWGVDCGPEDLLTRERLLAELSDRCDVLNGHPAGYGYLSAAELNALLDRLLQDGVSLPDDNGLNVTLFHLDSGDAEDLGISCIYVYTITRYMDDEPYIDIAVGYQIG